MNKVNIKDVVNIVKGSYWLTDEEGSFAAQHKLPKGKAWAVIGLGIIDIGDEEKATNQIEEYCKLFADNVEVRTWKSQS